MTRTLYVAEPPQTYLQKPPLVIDCSVLAAIFFNEGTRQEALLSIAGKHLQAPYLLDSEIVSVALKKLEIGLPREVVAAGMEAYGVQDIELHGTDACEQYEIARQYGLSGDDAAYLWLAGSLRIPLLTFDKKLARAAREHLAGLA